MAEAIAKEKIRELGLKSGDHEKVKIISAGTAAFPGCPASPQAVEVLRRKNIDLSCHKSQRISPEMLKEADYIFTMTVLQKQQVLFLYPEAAGKVFTLKEFAYPDFSRGLNIDDPFGGDADCYAECAAELEKAIIKMLEKVFC